MNWTCAIAEERLTDYLDGVLTPEEAAAFSAHTAGCASCARMLAEVSHLVSQMELVEQLEPPAHLTAKILDSTLGPRAEASDWRGWFDWMSLVWQPRFGMGLATVAASLAIVFHAVVPSGGKVTLASLSPLSVVRSANRQVHLTYAHGVKFVNDLRVVYEIESRLGPQPAPMNAPATAPQAPPSAQPSDDPHEKSGAVPHSGRHQIGDGLMAFDEPDLWLDGSTTRSLR